MYASVKGRLQNATSNLLELTMCKSTLMNHHFEWHQRGSVVHDVLLSYLFLGQPYHFEVEINHICSLVACTHEGIEAISQGYAWSITWYSITLGWYRSSECYEISSIYNFPWYGVSKCMEAFNSMYRIYKSINTYINVFIIASESFF